MSGRVQKSLIYSLLTTALATVIIYFWSDRISLPVFAVVIFLVVFTVAYWRLYSER